MTDEIIIAQTKKWISDVVVSCNFCPFAGREVKRESIHYEVLLTNERKAVLESLAKAFLFLDENPEVETTLLIIPGFPVFPAYLDLLGLAESLLEKEGYEGIYQLASFHPLYIFEGSRETDASNYTNRSPYPMLHILREASVSKAIDNYNGADISTRNISFTTDKGLLHMQALRNACMNL